jgi:hypothetical protein
VAVNASSPKERWYIGLDQVIGLAAAVLIVLFAFPAAIGRLGFGLWLVFMAPLIGVIVLLVRAIRQGLYVSSTGIQLSATFGSYRCPWSGCRFSVGNPEPGKKPGREYLLLHRGHDLQIVPGFWRPIDFDSNPFFSDDDSNSTIVRVRIRRWRELDLLADQLNRLADSAAYPSDA